MLIERQEENGARLKQNRHTKHFNACTITRNVLRFVYDHLFIFGGILRGIVVFSEALRLI